MKNKIWKKTILKYSALQAIAYLIIFVFVFSFYYFTKSKQADLILLNIRNDLIIGDFRTAQQNLSNALSSGFTHIEISDNQKKRIISTEDQKTYNQNNLLILKKNINPSVDSKTSLYEMKFYFATMPILINSFLIWLLFALIGTPFMLFEKKRLEVEYDKKLNEEKNNILRNLALQISHDIRSPIAVLNSLKNEVNDKEFKHQKQFFEAVDRINILANDLLREDIGSENKLVLERIEISEFISRQVEQKKIEFKNHQHDICFSHNSNFMLYSLISSELTRVFSNLINNSIESIPKNKKGIIDITLNYQENYALICIADNGTGIPSAILSKLGSTRVTSKANSKSTGFGLGILHAKKIIESFGGEFKIESAAGVGTKILLFIPAEYVEKSRQVILIDNDELIRMIWTRNASKKNLKFTAFNGANELSTILKELSMDTQFYIDSELDDIKGEQLAEQLYLMGFTELHLTTGYSSERFKEYVFLKSIISKTPPF